MTGLNSHVYQQRFKDRLLFQVSSLKPVVLVNQGQLNTLGMIASLKPVCFCGLSSYSFSQQLLGMSSSENVFM